MVVLLGLGVALATVPPVLPESPTTESEVAVPQPDASATEVPIQRPRAAHEGTEPVEAPAGEPGTGEAEPPKRRYDIEAIRARIHPRPGLPPVPAPDPPPRPEPASSAEEAGADAQEYTERAEGSIVSGVYRPVPRWKRVGLIASGSVTVAAIISAGISYAVGTREMQRAHNRASVLLQRGDLTAVGVGDFCAHSPDPIIAKHCGRSDAAGVAYGLSVATAVVGLASTTVFGILHIVHREPSDTTLSRIRPTSRGVAVTF